MKRVVDIMRYASGTYRIVMSTLNGQKIFIPQYRGWIFWHSFKIPCASGQVAEFACSAKSLAWSYIRREDIRRTEQKKEKNSG